MNFDLAFRGVRSEYVGRLDYVWRSEMVASGSCEKYEIDWRNQDLVKCSACSTIHFRGLKIREIPRCIGLVYIFSSVSILCEFVQIGDLHCKPFQAS